MTAKSITAKYNRSPIKNSDRPQFPERSDLLGCPCNSGRPGKRARPSLIHVNTHFNITPENMKTVGPGPTNIRPDRQIFKLVGPADR